VWAFDDAERGIIAEPFVGQTNTIIDRIREIQHAENTIIECSATPFPGSVQANWTGYSDGGNWYEFEGIEGWLCPVLLQFFSEAPKHIYLTIQ
jgi:hypothetical protein